MTDFFSKERITANPSFNRWLVPPAALAIHLSIGMAYGFSVFWLPLSKALGIKDPIACADTMSIWARAFATDCDWKVSDLGWMFTLFFVFLGTSAAVFGHWLEHAGPRKAGAVAALCWGGGLLLSAYGVYTHQLWLMWLGSGVIGGIGLGLGYISPVSTLIKWFPDRRGMATGMAIMGFGGGAMIGAPLANTLMSHFSTPTSVGVWQTFAMMGVFYFVAMMIGALCYRVPPTGWVPKGWVPPVNNGNSMITNRHVHVNHAHKTPQFWLLWAVLCLNVSAGIGVIGMASPMLQEVFGGALIGEPLKLSELSSEQLLRVTAIGAGFAGLLSLFNILGRIGWASLSDFLGRKRTYIIFFALGFFLYISAPWAGTVGSVAVFAGLFCIILTMYGGGFATIPAYLADIFGTQHVGAIHGRLLTAWATAGVLGPVIVNYLRDYQLDHGVPPSEAYNVIMYVLAALLLLGFVCNLLVKPVADKHYMTDAELEAERKLAHEKSVKLNGDKVESQQTENHPLLVFIAWTLVAIPISYGIYSTLQKAWILFH
ncbi:MAG: OFA family MFS transporter [Methylotenera sp.]|jgi:MFS family permease|uniref:OFA family MFS transporter n=1 Tax=Methylotenera sp. TaxID=2051956 RepID=UPI0027242010|nr:OFA family MFS transporter [Methylotenera sp.]MDO9151453.1 OFA family MFS transporter [Methylotenera sp.]